jgi:hypothetical protein
MSTTLHPSCFPPTADSQLLITAYEHWQDQHRGCACDLVHTKKTHNSKLNPSPTLLLNAAINVKESDASLQPIASP